MPIYTYQCENCGVRFEVQQSFNDPVLTRCPECKKKTLRKVYTPVGIVFKGSGFYATDHRSPSGAGRLTNKSTDTEKKTETASSSTSESSASKSGKSENSQVSQE
ncbi:MAG: zinc ribbon domain-containing protein [Anaerolineales bacterium]|nr:zinc ribbon domain-containing protein [Anaerolineales bacterium]